MSASSEDDVLYTQSGVSAFDGSPFVILTWGHKSAQMTPDEARAFALHTIEAADAAVTDSILVAELKAANLEDRLAAAFLTAVRERREALS